MSSGFILNQKYQTYVDNTNQQKKLGEFNKCVVWHIIMNIYNSGKTYIDKNTEKPKKLNQRLVHIVSDVHKLPTE